MRILSGIVLATLAAPLLVQAEEAKEQQIHDKPAVRGSIIANMLQDHDNPFTLYPYETNYVLYTDTSNINKEAIQSYNWSDNARKDEVKFQLSLAFPLWRGIAGDNSVLGASYTQRSWWQLSNHGESSPFRETNYEPQVFLGWATDYRFAGWTLRDVEVGPQSPVQRPF
jgi:phospholipase A1/A2